MKSNGNSVGGEFPFINFISNRCLVGFFFIKRRSRVILVLVRNLFILKSLSNLITGTRIWVKASITQAQAQHKTVVKITR